MNPIDLLQGPLVIVLYPLIMLAVLRIIAPNGIDFDDMLELPRDRDWPRGIQEEEPVRWRVERLSRRTEQPSNAPVAPSRVDGVPASQHSGIEGSIQGSTLSK